MKASRSASIGFAEDSVKKAFEALHSGTFEEKRLARHIQSAMDELVKNPLAGEKMQKRLWPKVYVQKYGIGNLHKLNLPDGWRLTYTLKGSEIEIVSVILEWMSHKNYEKRFGYKAR